MKIEEALKETGKAAWHIWADRSHVIKKGVQFYFINYRGEESPYNFDALFDDNWQPYHDKKEIRPELLGEHWRAESGKEYSVVYWKGKLCFHDLAERENTQYLDFKHDEDSRWYCSKEPIHGKGWTLLYSPDPEKMSQISGVERIEIENATIFRGACDYITGDCESTDKIYKLADNVYGLSAKLIIEIPK